MGGVSNAAHAVVAGCAPVFLSATFHRQAIYLNRKSLFQLLKIVPIPFFAFLSCAVPLICIATGLRPTFSNGCWPLGSIV